MEHGLCNIKKIHGKGNHLILDGYSKSEILNKKTKMKTFIKKLTKEISMTAISKPLVLNYKSKTKDKNQNGITATIILAESNITIHSYPHFNFFCLDIFSCNEFPITKTINFLTKELHITKYKKKLIKRGFYNGKN
jgi:S-adenosylmethionine decarboxylase